MTSREDSFERLLRAFAHWVHRNHDYTPTCLACVEGAAFLTLPGYQGNRDDPLVR